jgi:hypothetical protein
MLFLFPGYAAAHTVCASHRSTRDAKILRFSLRRRRRRRRRRRTRREAFFSYGVLGS